MPAILTSYANDPVAFRGAVDALVRFDNFDDPDEANHQSAAKFLNHYQVDPIFKEQLAKHGAILIPALSVGGENALSAIASNPRDIDKYVSADGVPITGKPWWTWVPGGSFAYLGREIVAGRSTESADWFWAGTDVLIFVPIVKGASVPVRFANAAGEKIAGRVIAEGAKEVGEAVAAKTLGRKALEESLILLRAAGIKVSKGSLWVVKNPRKSAIAGGGALCVLYPEQAAAIIDNGSQWVGKRAENFAKESGRSMTAMPGEFVKGVWEKADELANAQPLLAPIYYLLAIALILAVFLIPLFLLKTLLFVAPRWVADTAFDSSLLVKHSYVYQALCVQCQPFISTSSSLITRATDSTDRGANRSIS